MARAANGTLISPSVLMTTSRGACLMNRALKSGDFFFFFMELLRVTASKNVADVYQAA
jgi:hypothetical protein